MSTEVRIFKPIKRRLGDFFLFLNLGLFAAYAFQGISSALIGPLALVLNSALVLTWYAVVTPLMQVTLVNNVLTGREPHFKKASIALRKVDYGKTNTRTYGIRRRLFKDIWSTEGERIRLHRKFLGESQVGEIIGLIERYPFREGTSSKAENQS